MKRNFFNSKERQEKDRLRKRSRSKELVVAERKHVLAITREIRKDLAMAHARAKLAAIDAHARAIWNGMDEFQRDALVRDLLKGGD